MWPIVPMSRLVVRDLARYLKASLTALEWGAAASRRTRCLPRLVLCSTGNYGFRRSCLTTLPTSEPVTLVGGDQIVFAPLSSLTALRMPLRVKVTLPLPA